MENKKNNLLRFLVSILISLLLIILSINVFCSDLDEKMAIYLQIGSVLLTLGTITYTVWSFLSLFDYDFGEKIIDIFVKLKIEALVLSIILLAFLSLLPLVPLIFKGFLGYYVNYNLILSSIFWSYLASTILFCIGAAIRPRKYAIPIFIGAAILLPLASLFVISNHSSDLSWILIKAFILIAWIMLHVQFCMPVSNVSRRLVAAVILFVGLPATAMLVLVSGVGYAFERSNGMPFVKALSFWPFVILGPFVLICIVRAIKKFSSSKKKLSMS